MNVKPGKAFYLANTVMASRAGDLMRIPNVMWRPYDKLLAGIYYMNGSISLMINL